MSYGIVSGKMKLQVLIRKDVLLLIHWIFGMLQILGHVSEQNICSGY